MSALTSATSDPTQRIRQFLQFVRTHIRGDERGEAQIFCDRLFQAFGHDGIMEAGGTLEYRIHQRSKTSFADLLWRPRLLLEMKRRGEKLDRHYQQAFEYWLHLVPDRPHYVVLCNFDEFWIYDLNHQLDEPMDRVTLQELPDRYTALNFLFPEQRRPLFENDRVAVTKSAAASVAQLFNHLVQRAPDPVPRERAQRFALQSVVALFAEDTGLLPRGLFSELLEDSAETKNAYDLIGGLFRQMAQPTKAEGGRYRDVPYFNGGLFKVVEPIELTRIETDLLRQAAKENWAKVHPAIFGSLFEGSMDQSERHALGAHFTSEVDIQKVILPTIVRPWRERIHSAEEAAELTEIWTQLLSYRVLDPACGSGNFLYIAYRELKRVEAELLEKLYSRVGKRSKRRVKGTSLVSASQFFGIDITPFAVELAKVTLMLAKVLALRETTDRLASGQQHLPFDFSEQPLPLDNLDANFIVEDALVTVDGGIQHWPRADVIIGNPPFLGAKRLKPLRGADYANRLRKAYPEVPGMADYCVYWFRRAQDHLPSCSARNPTSGRAGLVGTQNIRSNKSREGGLDHIVASGTIIEAVENQPWSGEANVHVSIVNWVKTQDQGLLPDKRRLWKLQSKTSTKPGKSVGTGGSRPPSALIFRDVPFINSSLTDGVDISTKQRLACNLRPKRCFQGKIPGYDGFLLDRETMERLAVDSSEVIFPYLIGRELLDEFRIERWIIDFGRRNLLEAAAYPSAFKHCEEHVLPEVEESLRAAVLERSDMEEARREHLDRWWQLWNRRDQLTASLQSLSRYIGCSRVTRRPIMVFLSTALCPSDLVQVFALDDDYSFGILQSAFHFEWFRTSSRMKVEADSRYSVREVFETFPWPQSPTAADVQGVAEAARHVRRIREHAVRATPGGLRATYRILELPGRHPLRAAHEELDEAVRAAYGAPHEESHLSFLLSLNRGVSAELARGSKVEGPGLPSFVSDRSPYITPDAYTT